MIKKKIRNKTNIYIDTPLYIRREPTHGAIYFIMVIWHDPYMIKILSMFFSSIYKLLE